jgi:hypothetical protein
VSHTRAGRKFLCHECKKNASKDFGLCYRAVDDVRVKKYALAIQLSCSSAENFDAMTGLLMRN